MIQRNVFTLFKFLAGILLIQAAAAVLTFAALKSEHIEVWLLLGTLALATGLVVTFWFASLAGQLRKDALARLKKDFFQEREAMQARAEREKSKIIKRSHQQIAKERKRAQHKASFKVGASLTAALGLAALMLLTQFITIGLLTLTAAGGAVGGYLFRARQERRPDSDEAPGLPSAKPTRLGTRAPWHPRMELLKRVGAPPSGSPESPA